MVTYGTVTKVMVGLHQIGIVGLFAAFKDVEADGISDGEDRDAFLDAVLRHLGEHNYIPGTQLENYRAAVYREYLRQKGQDFSEFFSELDVVVHGEPGDARDQFVAMTRSVLGDFELKPIVTFESPGGEGIYPQLHVDDKAVVSGMLTRGAFKNEVQRNISDW